MGFKESVKKFNSGRSQAGVGKVIATKYFDEVFDGFCIECGALDGITLSVCRDFVNRLGWKCLNIEANIDSYNKLIKNRPEAINLNYALSDTDDSFLFITNPSKKKLARVAKKAHKDNHKVPTRTYKSIIEDLKITKVDLFILDVEGHEAQAIRGMIGCDVLPKVICLEAHKDEHLDKIKVELSKLNGEYVLAESYRYNHTFVLQ